MAYMMTMNHGHGRVVSGEFRDGDAFWRSWQVNPEGDMRLIGFQGGYRVDLTDMRPEVSMRNSSLRNIHVFSCRYRWAVSQPVKDAIERVEPGVHQFARLRVIPRKGQTLDTEYYILNVCNLVRAIDGKATTVECNLYDDGARKVYRAFPEPGKKLVVSRELVAGMAVWMDRECQGNFIGDDLHDVIVSLGARNLELVQVDEI